MCRLSVSPKGERQSQTVILIIGTTQKYIIDNYWCACHACVMCMTTVASAVSKLIDLILNMTFCIYFSFNHKNHVKNKIL